MLKQYTLAICLFFSTFAHAQSDDIELSADDCRRWAEIVNFVKAKMQEGNLAFDEMEPLMIKWNIIAIEKRDHVSSRIILKALHWLKTEQSGHPHDECIGLNKQQSSEILSRINNANQESRKETGSMGTG